MNILYIDYQMYGKDDIVDAFQSLGYKVDVTDLFNEGVSFNTSRSLS